MFKNEVRLLFDSIHFAIKLKEFLIPVRQRLFNRSVRSPSMINMLV